MLLGTVFLVLKLCHVIEWSWFWVTCPFWAGLALTLVVAICAVVSLIIYYVKKWKTSKHD